ncbi:hypothetical protein EG327_001379 [Venturia inaequalis]|uniref:BTB domain-containing protein n=1 Tax=Venturia inaequalis TaxID=5025 RepID=A0A8H3ZEM7_VENIN|nr:hypothetical protein EG327_001379 [Venturia inaequalis]
MYIYNKNSSNTIVDFNSMAPPAAKRIKFSVDSPGTIMSQLTADLGPTTTIDEEGDLTFIVGEAKHRIVVASKVLVLVSKVFKKMLSNQFKEGRELIAANGKGYELELPDDDPAACIVMFNIVHYRPAFQPTEVEKQKRDLDVLRALALLADKYDCVGAIEPVFSRWIAAVARTRVSGDDTLLLISYLLNDAQMFKKVSRRMIREHADDFDSVQKIMDPSGRLPSRIFELLGRRRIKAINNIADLCSAHLKCLSQGTPRNPMKVHGLNPSSLSQHDMLKLGSFFRGTSAVQGTCKAGTSINDRLKQLRGIKDDKYGLLSESPHCRACKCSVEQDIMVIADKAEKAVKGLCLDCFQYPDKFGGGNCRVKHVRLGKGKHEHQDVGAYFTQSIVDTMEWPDGDECFGEGVFEFFEDGTLAATLINLVWDKQQDSRNKKIGLEYGDRKNTTDVRSFNEGRQLAENSAVDQRYELPLPDDDATAMSILCKIFHMRHEDVPRPGKIQDSVLYNVAVLSEKYDCVAAIKPVSAAWLFARCESTAHNDGTLLLVAMLLDEPEAFKKVSKHIVMSFGLSFTEVAGMEELKDRMIELLEQAREQSHMLMSQIITREIENMSNDLDFLEDEEGWEDGDYTKHDAIRVARFVGNLRLAKLWPRDGSATSATRSIQGAVSELLKFRDFAPIETKGKCRACKKTLKSIVVNIANEIRREVKGICLDCVKATDPTNSVQCRIEH